MKTRWIFAICAMVNLTPVFPACAAVFDHSSYDSLLRRYVDEDGYVDYDSIRLNSMTALESYFENLATADLSGWPATERLAFWINAYNAQVLYRIAQQPGAKKIPKGIGLYDRPFKIAGRSLSPNDIKLQVLRRTDPRIHFALADGTVSSPKLRNFAYTAENLNITLQVNAVAFANSFNYVSVVHGRLQLSSLFKWQAEDFKKLGGVQTYIASLLLPDQRGDSEAIRQLLKTAYNNAAYTYDWTINDQKNKPHPPQQRMLTPEEIPPDALSTSNPDLRENGK